jgi:hypothetical protein
LHAVSNRHVPRQSLNDIGATALVQNIRLPAEEVRERLTVAAVANYPIGDCRAGDESSDAAALTLQWMVHDGVQWDRWLRKPESAS